MHSITGSIKKNNILPGLIAAALAGWSGGAGATDFESDSGWSGAWINTLSVNSTWRAANPDGALFSGADGQLVGRAGGTAAIPTDAGNLNYGKHDRIASIVKLISELEVKRGTQGAFLRAKFWYDQAARDTNVPYGNMANGYAQHAPLSDAGFERLQKFDGAYLLDAYVYDTFQLADLPMQARLGRQVVNWGESLYIQGVNQINPLDLGTLRRPGAELKEALLPQWMVSANLGLGGGKSLEAFYQFKWENTAIDGCGTYWSVTEGTISTTPGHCTAATLVPVPNASLMSSPVALANGLYVPLAQGKKAKDSGQFGFSFRFPVEALDTEFGLYAMNIHARTPIISGMAGTNITGVPGTGGLISPVAAMAPLGLTPMQAFWEYPENVQVYAISASGNVGGWSVGSELSYSPNTPVQRNGNDLLAAALRGIGPLGAIATGLNTQGAGTVIPGYDRFHKVQYQANSVATFANVLDAQQAILVAEAGFQWNNVPDFHNPDSIRYGRAFMFGNASHPLYGGSTCGAVNPSPDGCQNDGFVTRFAWGYRIKGQLEYANLFGSGVSALPNAFLARDVKGYSLDSQFLEGRQQVGLGVQFSYQKKYLLDLNYTTFSRRAKYDPLRDRDYFGVTLSATF